MDGSLVMEPQTSRSRMRPPRVAIKSIYLALQGKAARTPPLPGVSSTACWRMSASRSKASARRAQGQLTRRCSLAPEKVPVPPQAR